MSLGVIALMNAVYKHTALAEEAAACLLCHRAPCTKACPHGLKPDKVIRSLRFENSAGAAGSLPDILPCASCEKKDCKAACLKKSINRAVDIDHIMMALSAADKPKAKDADLSIDFCGVRCENPFFLSSSVVASNKEMIAKPLDMGCA